ncbi:formate dehydrogenase accessory protein FdhE [Planctomycetota bacterium]
MQPAEGTTYAEVLSQLESLSKEQPELQVFTEQLSRILKWQQEVFDTFKPDMTKVDSAQGLKRNLKGKPFLRPEDLVIDHDQFHELLTKVAGEACRSQGNDNQSGPQKPDEPHPELLRAIMYAEAETLAACAEYFSLPVPIFVFSAHQALIPFLEGYAHAIREQIDESTWMRGRCPVCGGEPLMAKLTGEGGQRYLQCGLCRTEWLYKRMECPFCGNDDQDTLRYFFGEEDKRRMVEVCEKCKGYIKTVDVRDMYRHVPLLVEDALTLPLDMAARQEGYGRGGSELFGL